jgi:hypothetical protein
LSGGRKFIATTYAEFWRRYSALPPALRHHYEIVRQGSPCHLYFGAPHGDLVLWTNASWSTADTAAAEPNRGEEWVYQKAFSSFQTQSGHIGIDRVRVDESTLLDVRPDRASRTGCT